MSDPFTAIGLGLSALGALKQRKEAKKAEKAQRKAANEQKKLNDAQATRERQKTVREAIRRQAIIANSAGVTGTLGSSAAQGGIGGLSSEAGGNVGYINTVTAGNNRISDYNVAAQSATNRAATYGQVSELGFAAVSNANAIGSSFGAASAGASSFFGGTGYGTGVDVYRSVNNPANAGIY